MGGHCPVIATHKICVDQPWVELYQYCYLNISSWTRYYKKASRFFIGHLSTYHYIMSLRTDKISLALTPCMHTISNQKLDDGKGLAKKKVTIYLSLYHVTVYRQDLPYCKQSKTGWWQRPSKKSYFHVRLRSTSSKPVKCIQGPIVYVSNYSWYCTQLLFIGEAAQMWIPKFTGNAWGLAVFEGRLLILAPNIRQGKCFFSVLGCSTGSTVYLAGRHIKKKSQKLDLNWRFYALKYISYT